MRCTPKVYRGFESPTFRNTKEKSVCPSLLEQADFSFVLQVCRRQTFGITQQSPTYKVPAAACWVFEVALPLQCRCPRIPFLSKSVCPSLLEQADFSFVLQGCLRADFRVFEVALFFVILIHFYRRSRIPLLYPCYTLRIILNFELRIGYPKTDLKRL